MQIKHVPIGLEPIQDCGFQRTPFLPRLGEGVQVQIKVEGARGKATSRLEWEVDGTAMPAIPGLPVKGKDSEVQYFAFTLGPFSSLAEVRYRFVVKDAGGEEATPDYRFSVVKQGKLSPRAELFRSEAAAYAKFPQLILEFSWAKGLRIRFLDKESACPGQRVESVSADLPAGAQLKLTAQGWEVWRGEKRLVGLNFAEVVFLQTQAGAVQEIRYQVDTGAQHIFGLGERFNQVDQKGLRTHLWVVEKFTQQGEYSYIPIPFFFTDSGFGWFSSSRRLITVDGQAGLSITCRTAPRGVLHEEWWLVGEPQALLKALHHLTGQAVLPPKWALGIWISANGWNTQKETLQQLEALERFQLPATAMVLEAWSDEHTFYIFNDAQYKPLSQDRPLRLADFQFPAEGKWPNPKAMAEAIQAAGLSLVLWQIPVIKYTPDACRQLQEDEAYAIKMGYCVLNEDGTPYRIPDNWFKGSLILDFTNPDAVRWWFNKRVYLVKDLGVKGFKTDGGEFLFGDTTKTFDGQTGATAHNEYPMQYVGAYHQFLREHIPDGITFSRAGYTGAQTVPIHWAGDQLSQWSELRAQLIAGLSAGLSGILFWSFDLGGFAGDFPSPELYLRAAALAAFCPVMQWHSEPRSGQFFYTDRARWVNDRSPWNIADLYQNEDIIHIYRLFANLRMNLLPYIYQEAVHCAKEARPLMAHLALDFPADSRVWTVHDEYMFGRDLLVAPVLEEGAEGRQVYLPEGTWHDLFTGETFTGGELYYHCPLDRIPVFVRDGAVLPVHLNNARIMGTRAPEGGVSNKLDRYEILAFVSFGGKTLSFQDDLGTKLVYTDGTVQGSGPVKEVLLVDALAPGDAVCFFGRGLAGRLAKVEEKP